MAILMTAILSGCLEQRFELAEEMPVSGEANPAFALALASGSWTVQDALDQLESLDWESDPVSGSAMFVQPFELLAAAPIKLPLINESFSEVFQLDATMAQALSNLPEGEQFDIGFETTWEWELPSMDSVDSLWVEQGMLSVFVSSDIPMDQTIQVMCTNLYAEGSPIVLELDLDYTGQLPLQQTAIVSTTDARGLFGNSAGVEVLFDWDIVFESSGAFVEKDANISIEVNWEEVMVSGAFGKFGSHTTVDFDVAQPLPLLAEWNPDQLHFADPRIRLSALNSSGIPIGIQWEQFAFISDEETWDIGGPDIESFPTISAATTVGAWEETVHVIDNSGTTPTLTEAMELQPDSAIISGQLVLNPANENSNFLTNESTLQIQASLEVPLVGWGRGLTWKDTIAGAISQDLNAGINPPLDWQDVASVTLRFIANNGWPIGLDMQARFLDSNDAVVDSLYSVSDPGAFHISAGQIDESTPSNDSFYGRVVQSTQTIMDLILTREQALELLSMDCQAVEIAFTLATQGAQDDAQVRFFFEDEFDLKLSARVECAITLEP